MKLTKVAAVCVVGVFALSGCSQDGGVAARVDGTVIPMSDVALLTRVQCDAMAASRGAPGATVVPTSQVRASAVNALVEAEINRRLGEAGGVAYDTARYRAAVDQLEQALSSVKAADRDATRDLITGFYRGQFQLMALAQDELDHQGVTEPSDEELGKTVAELQDRFRKANSIEVDPSFGPDAAGVAGKLDPSLSLPVSSFAKQAASAQPDAKWVEGLPPSQRCG